MFRRVITGSKGVKLVTAAVLLLVLLAWAGSTVRTTGAEGGEPAAPADPENTEGPEDAKDPRVPEWEGFKSRGPDLPVERLVITMVILVGGGGIALWVLRRIRSGPLGLRPVRHGGVSKMQLVGRLPLGGRRGLVLVRAAGRLLVLGVSEAGVQKVLEREDREYGEDDQVDQDDFAGALERLGPEEER